MRLEELMELKRIEQLPHGKAIVEERKGSQNASDIVIYTGYLEPTTSGWLHIYKDSGRAFSVSRDRVIKIVWDKQWKVRTIGQNRNIGITSKGGLN